MSHRRDHQLKRNIGRIVEVTMKTGEVQVGFCEAARDGRITLYDGSYEWRVHVERIESVRPAKPIVQGTIIRPEGRPE